jgi:hypothetical protein
MSEINEIRELSVDELAAVGGGTVTRAIVITTPKTMTELYQGWADLGNILKDTYLR